MPAALGKPGQKNHTIISIRSSQHNYDGISKNPKPDVFAKEISFKQTKLKVSFWVKDFNSKDKYKIIITNEIRKLIGEYNE